MKMDDRVAASTKADDYGRMVDNTQRMSVSGVTGGPGVLKWDEIDNYDFQHPKRGVALIVCNEEFVGYTARRGADRDAEHFQEFFKRLGFDDIRVKYNLTAEDMKHWFKDVSKEDHSKSDCLAVAVTSHGEKDETTNYNVIETRDVIVGSSGSVYTEDLLALFSDKKCPTLVGKPRIFLLQACRGQKLDPGVEVLPPGGEDVVDALCEPEYTVSPPPCYKDFCVVYATPPGHFAFRRPEEGSWFVTGLRDTAERIDPAKMNFHKLLTRAIGLVAKKYQSYSTTNPDIDKKKQSGCVYSMLTKDIYFTPKPQNTEKIHYV